MLPTAVREAVDDLLARLDDAVPGRVEGFYVVGSACMGAFRPGRSDVDFVAIVNGDLGRAQLARLRAIHLARWASAVIGDGALRRHWPLVCNGCYLNGADLSRSPLEVTPVAAHSAGRFRVAQRGFDVNPVTWHTLARHGIAIRGPEPERLDIRTDDGELRAWTLANLNGYWRRWSQHARRSVPSRAMALPRRFAASGSLGAPRLHYTLTTGAITTKEDAGRYALEVFAPRWHTLIDDALAFWRGLPASDPYRHHPARRRREAAAFVASIVDAANTLAAPQPTTSSADRRA